MDILEQGDLFAAAEPAMPAGFRYKRGIVPAAMQADLLREIPRLPLKADQS
jgi:hypothetical protein